MSAIDAKLDHCGLSLEDVRDTSTVQDVPRFLARFTAYASQVSAVRQYLQNALHNLRSATVHPEQQWLQDLEDQIDFAAVMGLRHVDQHTETIRVERQHADVKLSETILTFESALDYEVRGADGQIKMKVSQALPRPQTPHRPTQSSLRMSYFCDATALPGFMTAQSTFKNGFGRVPGGPVLKKGDDLPLKAPVIAYLKTTDLLTVAERAYNKLTGSIGYAKSKALVP